MKFSNEEMALITRAKKSAMSNKVTKLMILIFMGVFLVLFGINMLTAEQLSVLLVGAILVAIIQPGINPSPSFEQLVALLERKAREQIKEET